MGLFRRGTQLLRLGSGLRDCCCRPENPEECWCNDFWCSYYWDWGGTTLFPAKQYLTDSCKKRADFEIPTRSGPVGFLSSVQQGQFKVGGSLNEKGGAYLNAPYFLSDVGIVGPLSPEAHQEIFGFPANANRNTIAQYYVKNSLSVYCRRDSNGRANGIFFDAERIAVVRVDKDISGFFGGFFYVQLIYRSSNYNELSVQVECIGDDSLSCPNFLNPARPKLHLAEDIAFVFDDTGITANGTLYEWDLSSNPLPIDNGNITDLWKVPGDFPFEATVTLKRRDSCRPGPCDCNLDLTGRTVVFEGQTFTYGSLQQFISDDGLTIWEEGPSAGRFTREDRRECDPTVSMRVRTAEVSCSTFDGVPRWFVYLDSECYERENGGCAPTVTASKITLYNGALSCDSDGYPLGAAHSFTDDTDPPDLDGENISGTPSANCDVENPIPSISFS